MPALHKKDALWKKIHQYLPPSRFPTGIPYPYWDRIPFSYWHISGSDLRRRKPRSCGITTMARPKRTGRERTKKFSATRMNRTSVAAAPVGGPRAKVTRRGFAEKHAKREFRWGFPGVGNWPHVNGLGESRLEKLTAHSRYFFHCTISRDAVSNPS